MPESKPAAKKPAAKKPAAKKPAAKQPAAKKPAAKKPAAKKPAQKGGLGYDPSQQIGYDPRYDNNMDDYDRRMFGTMTNAHATSDAARAWMAVDSTITAIADFKAIKKQTVMGGDNCKVDRINAAMNNARGALKEFSAYFRESTISLQGKNEVFGRVSSELNTVRMQIIADVYYSKNCGARLDPVNEIISLLTAAVKSFSELATKRVRLLSMSGLE